MAGRPTWVVALVLLTGVVAAATVDAQEEDALRPCRRADLIGFWRVIRFGFAVGAEIDRGDPAYQAHQRYVFNANATMAYTATDTPPTAAEHRALLLAPAPVTWAVDARGRLLRHEAGATRASTSACQVVTREVRDPRSKVPVLPGDVLLTDQGDNERPLTRRLLRRLQLGP
jgi:hypothetical protein